MRDLPKSIGKIKYLKYLDLSGNNYLTHLPDSIRTLTKLQTLKLGECRRLTQLPNGITRLVSLRLLDLWGCQDLTHLPDGVTRLVNLRHLGLGGCCSLTHLPDGIGNLINLRHLNLCGCSRLTHFSVGIGRLMNLRHLDLRHCEKLTHLPDDITRLVNLEHLDISSSNVTQLPNGMGQLVNLRMMKWLGWFSVGRESGQRITELQGLNHLRGSLQIRGLEHVRDAREAEAAVLKNKNNLSSLSLIWKDLQGSNESSDKVEDVLEALQPPQSLNEELVIRGYSGSVFASWMKLLENLVEIELKDCIKCERLPPLGQLPFLKLLTITGMKSLKCIGTEFYGSNDSSSERCTIFPSLQLLEFEDMPNLDEWQDTKMKDNQQTDPPPCLKRLTLSRCPKLTSLPSLILSFVQDIFIYDCDKVIVRSLSCLTSLVLCVNSVTSFPEGSLENLDALKSFEIMSCSALQSLSQKLQYLSTVEDLHLSDCDQLEFSSEDFQKLISLQSLRVSYLPKLMSFPSLQRFSKLEKLTIEACKNLIRLWPHGTQNLTVLRELTFNDCEQLELSSADFQHLIKLQRIQLTRLPKLTSLPTVQHLYSLRVLHIAGCENLKMLPQGLKNLTTLEELRIIRCHHDLHSGCVKDSGEYWPFIKHIPDVRISVVWGRI